LHMAQLMPLPLTVSCFSKIQIEGVHTYVTGWLGVEFANSVWCPYKIVDSKEIEKIQKRATKLVIKLKNKSYIDRLIYLNLPTLKYRRLRGDMIEVFKITHNIYDRTVSPDLSLNERANTRGNHYKLQNHTFHYDLRKHFFLHVL